MSNSAPNRFQRQRDIFEQALEIAEAAERADFLAEACGDDRALWEEVQALLAAEDESPTEFMAPQADFAPDPPAPGETPGTVIGPYTLIDQLGDGAFGVVWRAEQAKPVLREVALKIIKPGMDSSEVVARFEAERQALALMDHPSIAQVYDAGTTDLGRPYFVMELVRGVPITNYCTEQKLSIEARLRLFIEVCRAVQHAHQKGVIHRDLKPSNILVVAHDPAAAGLPKVIDFGIAKAIDQELASRTLNTLEGAFLGTPQYMSPEQTGVSGSDIDTRADVYALGAVLYELLTGSTPLTLEQLKAGGWGEMERLIREEEPPKPSVRTTTVDATRSRHLRGDLDWVVMKALEKERDRRYETANEVARELEHFLANEPVSAGPPTLGYRTRKFLRRNRTLAASLATIALVLVAAAIISSVLAVRAKKAERDALDAERSARTAEGKANEAKLAEAEKSRALATQLSAAMTERAWQRTADGDPSEALLWHLEASRLALGEGDRVDNLNDLERLKIGASVSSIPPVNWLGFEVSGLSETATDPQGTWFAVAGHSPNRLTIREGATGNLLLRREVPWVNYMKTDGAGKILALSVAKGVLLFRIEALDEAPTLVPYESPYRRMDLNHDGSLLALVSMDRPLVIYDIAKQSILHELEVPWPDPGNLKPAKKTGVKFGFSPVDDRIALATTTGVYQQHTAFTCINGRTGKTVLSAGPFRGNSEALRFSPGGRFCGFDSSHGGWRGVRFWDLSSERELDPFQIPLQSQLRQFRILGDKLICAYNDRIKVHSFPPPFDLLAETTLPSKSGKHRRVQCSRDGSTFLVGPHGGGSVLSIVSGRTDDSAFLASSKGKTRVERVALSAAGQECLRVDSSGVIRSERVWVLRPPDMLLWKGIEGHTHRDKAVSARYTHNGAEILGVFGQTGASMWDADTGSVLHEFGSADDPGWRLALSDDAAHFALGFAGGRISIRSQADPTREIRSFDFGGGYGRLILSNSGRYCVVHGGPFYRIWKVETGEMVAELSASGIYGGATLLVSPDDRWVLGQYFPGNKEVAEHGRFLHRIADGTRQRVLLDGREGMTTRFSRDGRFVIGGQHVLRVEADGKVRNHRSFSTGAAPPSYCALANDGARVALVEFDGSVNTWNIESGARAAPPIPADAEAIVAAFSPDDRLLATGSLGGEVRIWDVDTGELLAGPLKAGTTRVVNLQFRPSGPLQLLVATESSRLTVWNLTRPIVETASLDDLRTAAEILANRRIDEQGEVKTLDWSELNSRWKSMNPTVRALVTRKPVESTNPAE